MLSANITGCNRLDKCENDTMLVLEAEARPWEEFVTPLTPILGSRSYCKLGETAREIDLQ